MIFTFPSGGCADEKSRFTEEQIVLAMKQAELGTSLPEVASWVFPTLRFTSKQKIGGISPPELLPMRLPRRKTFA